MGDQRNIQRRPVRSWYEPLGQHGQVDGEDERQWPLWLMILGIFGTIVTFWSVTMFTFITYWTLGQVLVVLMFAGNLFPGLGRKLRMGRGLWFMFNMLAIGPLLFSALLWINLAFTTGTRNYVLIQPGEHLDPKRYWIEHGQLPDGFYLEIGTAKDIMRAFDRIQNGDRVLTLAKGCLGFDVMRSYEPFYGPATVPQIPDSLFR